MVSDKRQVKEVGGKEGYISAYSSRAIESFGRGKPERQLATLHL